MSSNPRTGRASWSGATTAWATGGIIGCIEAIVRQDPVVSLFVISDRSVYLYAFLSYGLAGCAVYAALRLLWRAAAPAILTRSLTALGFLALALSVVYAAVPGYRLLQDDTTAAAPGPNIILITLDTTRADHLGCYGYGPKTSPFLDSLAAKGTLYEDAYTTATWTLPAHTSLFTGMMPTVHGVGYSNFFVSPSLQTLAELLRDKGYTTGGFIGGPFLISDFNINQGFEYYDEQLDPHSTLKRLALFRAASMALRSNLWNTDGQRRADEINGQLFPYLDWLKGRGSFFLFVNYFDPHEPYDPPAIARRELGIQTSMSGHIRQYFIDKSTGVARHRDGTLMTAEEFRQLQSLYDGEIRFLDDQLSLLWRKLESNGLLENTIVILTGDHGESIGEHQFLDHGHTLYQEQVRIPMIVLGPDRWDGGHRFSAPVEITDIFPTVLRFAGITPPEGIQGRTLRTLLDKDMFVRTVLAELDADPHPRYKAFNRSLRMILQARTKLLEPSAGPPELYDLIQDPGELNNAASGKAEAADQLRRQMNDHFRVFGTMRHQGKGEMDPETREKLKALGYIE